MYGYLQELIFQAGLKPFGWYITTVQFGCYSIFSTLELRARKTPLSRQAHAVAENLVEQLRPLFFQERRVAHPIPSQLIPSRLFFSVAVPQNPRSPGSHF